MDDIGGRRYVGHNGDQNGFKAYLSVCPEARAASLLAFNTETRATMTGSDNLLSPGVEDSARRAEPLPVYLPKIFKPFTPLKSRRKSPPFVVFSSPSAPVT